MTTFIPSFEQKIQFRPDHFNPVTIAENERVKVIEACFEPGQFIPVHRPGVDMTLVVLQGRGWFLTENAEQPIAPGAFAFVPAGEARGIKAETLLVILHVVTPPPTDADHLQVGAGLAKGAPK